MVTEYFDDKGLVRYRTLYENGVLSYETFVKKHKAWRTDFEFTKYEQHYIAQGMLKVDAHTKYDLGSFNADDKCVEAYINDVADVYPGIKDIYNSLCAYNQSLLAMSTLAQFMVNCCVSETKRFACLFDDGSASYHYGIKNVMYIFGKSSWRHAKPEVRRELADNIINAINSNKYECVWTFKQMLSTYGGKFAPPVKEPRICYHHNELTDKDISWLTDNCDDEPTEEVKNKYLAYLEFIRYSLFYITQKNPDEGYDEYEERVAKMFDDLSREPEWIRFDGLHRISKAMRGVVPNLENLLKVGEEYPDTERFNIHKSAVEQALDAVNRSRELIKDYVNDYNEQLSELF